MVEDEDDGGDEALQKVEPEKPEFLGVLEENENENTKRKKKDIRNVNDFIIVDIAAAIQLIINWID